MSEAALSLSALELYGYGGRTQGPMRHGRVRGGARSLAASATSDGVAPPLSLWAHSWERLWECRKTRVPRD